MGRTMGMGSSSLPGVPFRDEKKTCACMLDLGIFCMASCRAERPMQEKNNLVLGLKFLLAHGYFKFNGTFDDDTYIYTQLYQIFVASFIIIN